MSGEAHGINRKYEEMANAVVEKSGCFPGARPYEKDGIDIRFSVCGTRLTYDIVWRTVDDKLIVFECKRRKGRVKQDDILAFAKKIECLSRGRGVEVSGVFIVRSDYQKGAMCLATEFNIQMMIAEQDQLPAPSALTFVKYNPVTGRKEITGVVNLTARIEGRSTMTAKLTVDSQES